MATYHRNKVAWIGLAVVVAAYVVSLLGLTLWRLHEVAQLDDAYEQAPSAMAFTVMTNRGLTPAETAGMMGPMIYHTTDDASSDTYKPNWSAEATILRGYYDAQKPSLAIPDLLDGALGISAGGLAAIQVGASLIIWRKPSLVDRVAGRLMSKEV